MDQRGIWALKGVHTQLLLNLLELKQMKHKISAKLQLRFYFIKQTKKSNELI